MTALKIGLNWRLHDGEVRRKWKLVGNDEEVDSVKNVTFSTGVAYINNVPAFIDRDESNSPPFPSSVLEEWFGEHASKMKGAKLLVVRFEHSVATIVLTFSDTTIYVVVDPSYDVALQEEDALHEIELMKLPFVKTKTYNSSTRLVHTFAIPRVLVYDFVFSLMRMGGPELHCNRDDLKNAVEQFLQK